MLILASNSPRRKQLLALGGWPFSILPAEVDERPFAKEAAPDYVLRLAQDKAWAAARQAPAEAVIIAADTTVVDEGEILGKPEDAPEAERMLRRLRGRVHQVYTALTVLRISDGRMRSEICCTQVPMRSYSDEEMLAYIATGDPLDKAGAYAIQHKGFHPVESLQGCYANVVGLPLCLLTRLLSAFDIFPEQDIPEKIQETLGYTCPIFDQVVAGAPCG